MAEGRGFRGHNPSLPRRTECSSVRGVARLARNVAEAVPHHLTQRHNRRQQTFFCAEDYALYKALLADGCRAAGVACCA